MKSAADNEHQSSAFDEQLWIKASSAAARVDVHRATIEKAGVPWTNAPVKHKVRYRNLVLKEGSSGHRRYYRDDVDALLIQPQSPSPSSKMHLTIRSKK